MGRAARARLMREQVVVVRLGFASAVINCYNIPNRRPPFNPPLVRGDTERSRGGARPIEDTADQ